MAKRDTFVVTMVVKIDKAERYDVCDVEDEVRCLFLDFGRAATIGKIKVAKKAVNR